MKYPNFREEKKLWKGGRDFIAGVDEAGRGPLAGPVIACAACFKNLKLKIKNLKIDDSKKLSTKNREESFKILTSYPDICWGIGEVSEKIIDKINILQATKLAMIKAVEDLEKKIKPEYLLIDGNFSIDIDIPQKSIIKGDAKVFSIAAASIIAKVTRDKIMANYHKKYPAYGFDVHKGYPTALHRQRIKEHGLCPIHRRSFNCGLRA
ncbi:MAG: ribonuclease HII [bacterium]|nr:ribonuclease HII [bacterium]